MCGRFTLIASAETIAGRFLPKGCSTESLSAMGQSLDRYNIAPTQQVLTITADRTGRKASLMRWGLVPSWAKDLSVGSRMINARAETLAEKPSFRTSFRRRRCVVIADSFYEWRKTGAERLPMRISLRSKELIAFAGLWDIWKGPDGETIVSCAIITTEPNSLLEPIHNRMPVILPKEAEDLWLDPDIQDTEQLSRLLVPYSADRMELYQVSSLVNSPANDGPECVAPVERLI